MALLNSVFFIFLLLFKFVSTIDCETELGEDGKGRYVSLIARHFPSKVYLEGDDQNIFCHCKSMFWMTCHVFPDQEELESLSLFPSGMELLGVIQKLGQSPFTTIKHLFTYSSDTASAAHDPILFTIPHMLPYSLFAELVLHFGPRKTKEAKQNLEFDRQTDLRFPWSYEGNGEGNPNFGMWPSGWPDHFIGISKCDKCSDPDVAECPILLTAFKANEIVWILRDSMHGLLMGTSETVPCMSNVGMKRLSTSEEARASGGFRDPLKRAGDSLLTLNQDYQAFILIDDSVMSPEDVLTAGGNSAVQYSSLSQADQAAAIAGPSQTDPGPSESGSDSSTQELIDSFDTLHANQEERVQAASSKIFTTQHALLFTFLITIIFALGKSYKKENEQQYIRV